MLFSILLSSLSASTSDSGGFRELTVMVPSVCVRPSSKERFCVVGAHHGDIIKVLCQCWHVSSKEVTELKYKLYGVTLLNKDSISN